MVEWDGLENRLARKCHQGSNPCFSAFIHGLNYWLAANNNQSASLKVIKVCEC